MEANLCHDGATMLKLQIPSISEQLWSFQLCLGSCRVALTWPFLLIPAFRYNLCLDRRQRELCCLPVHMPQDCVRVGRAIQLLRLFLRHCPNLALPAHPGVWVQPVPGSKTERALPLACAHAAAMQASCAWAAPFSSCGFLRDCPNLALPAHPGVWVQPVPGSKTERALPLACAHAAAMQASCAWAAPFSSCGFLRDCPNLALPAHPGVWVQPVPGSKTERAPPLACAPAVALQASCAWAAPFSSCGFFCGVALTWPFLLILAFGYNLCLDRRQRELCRLPVHMPQRCKLRARGPPHLALAAFCGIALTWPFLLILAFGCNLCLDRGQRELCRLPVHLP